jgi:hypothetical protein
LKVIHRHRRQLFEMVTKVIPEIADGAGCKRRPSLLAVTILLKKAAETFEWIARETAGLTLEGHGDPMSF